MDTVVSLVAAGLAGYATYVAIRKAEVYVIEPKQTTGEVLFTLNKTAKVEVLGDGQGCTLRITDSQGFNDVPCDQYATGVAKGSVKIETLTSGTTPTIIVIA